MRERKARLKHLLEARKGKAQADPLRRAFRDRRRRGAAVGLQLSLEGIVSKKLDAPYRSGRTDSWTKAKCRAGHEVVIGGWTTTDGKFRSLLVGVYRGEHLVYVGTRRHRLRRRQGAAPAAAR